ncbi:MAG: cytochrome P450 [Anaerolineae bacterium]|nr:cytochrome P450 [Anaerolineae bacterium]
MTTQASPAGQRFALGPTGIELFKSLFFIQRAPLAYLVESAHRYGDLAHFQIGTQHAYLVSSPSAIKRVLLDNHRNYAKNTIQYRQLAQITGDGLLTSDGDFWMSHRKSAQAAFTPQRLERVLAFALSETQAMIDQWQAQSKRQGYVDVDMYETMCQLALRVVGRALLSIDLSQEAPKLVRAMENALEHIVYRVTRFIDLPDRVLLSTWRFRAAVQTLDQAVFSLIAQRRNMPERPADFLTDLISTTDDGQPLSDKEVRDEIVTMLIAGHETVAAGLTWAWHLLADHPAEQAALRRESQAVLASGRLCLETLPKLRLARCVFSEALRLYPPAWLITRRALGADVLDEHFVPAGAFVIICPFIVHRHSAFWTEPERFLPQRFDPEQERNRPRFAYIPFGAGPRLCIGQHFALVEAIAVLALMTQQCRIERIPNTRPATPLAQVTLRPPHGTKLRVRLECP